jgi:hypothetical protein
MTPDEVRKLQQFAEANGTTLTINPTTGLPEAGFLSDLFKSIAPIALGAFLGPAGFGLSSMMAGVATGGITALATGSLSRGLMAGLGAYGGAGLGESLMTAGGGMSAANAATAAQGQLGATNLALGEALPAQAAEQFTQDAIARMTPSGAVSAGFNAATASPTAAMNFAKGNLGNLAYAAAPIMAGAMVPTTTQAPTGKNENYIRQFDFNINPDTGKPDPLYGVRAMTPVKANEFGNKTFQGQRNLFRQQNPNPYELGVGSLNQPPQQQQQTTPMATGGIVALAGGGDVQRFAIGDLVKADIDKAYTAGDYAKVNELVSANKITAADVSDTYKGFDTSGLAGLGVNLYTPPAAPTYNQFTNEQIGSFLSNPVNKDIDIQKAIKDTNADPAAVNRYIASLTSPFVGSTDTKGGSGTFGIYNNMITQGIDPNEYYAAALANDPKYGGWDKGMIQKGYNLDKGALALGAQIEKDKIAADPKLGYDKQWVNFMDTNNYSIDDMAQAFGLSRNEVKARYDAVKNAEKKTTIVGGTGNDTIVGGTGNDVINNTFGSSTKVARKITNPYGNATNPGDLTFNTDGTTTVQPNIPYRPYGGFRGIQEIKNAYTAGGGSLGYTSRAPQNTAEFNQLYDKQTGDSLAAYDYLMGKGGGKYPSKSLASQMAVPYAEYALGKKTVGLKPITKTTGTGTTTYKEPQTYFDEKAYLAANPDVEAEMKAGKSNFATAYEHYLRYGKAEGRKFAGDYDSYLAAVEADKARVAQQVDAGGTGGDDGGDDGGGDGGGNGTGAASGDCVDPNVHILLADGGTVRAGDLKIGDMLYTLHDTTFVYGNYPVEYLNILQRPKVEALFDDGQKIIISITHKFLTADNEWKKISELEIGTAVRGLGDVTKKLVSTTDLGVGPVVEMVVTEAHTYISEGLVSHNKYYGGLVNGKAAGGMTGYAVGGGLGSLGSYSDGGRLLKGPGDGVSDSIPATIGAKQQPARLADGEFVIPARIVSELGNGSTDAGAKKLYAMMDRVQRARGKTTGKNKVAANSRSDKYLPA